MYPLVILILILEWNMIVALKSSKHTGVLNSFICRSFQVDLAFVHHSELRKRYAETNVSMQDSSLCFIVYTSLKSWPRRVRSIFLGWRIIIIIFLSIPTSILILVVIRSMSRPLIAPAFFHYLCQFFFKFFFFRWAIFIIIFLSVEIVSSSWLSLGIFLLLTPPPAFFSLFISLQTKNCHYYTPFHSDKYPHVILPMPKLVYSHVM